MSSKTVALLSGRWRDLSRSISDFIDMNHRFQSENIAGNFSLKAPYLLNVEDRRGTRGQTTHLGPHSDHIIVDPSLDSQFVKLRS